MFCSYVTSVLINQHVDVLVNVLTQVTQLRAG